MSRPSYDEWLITKAVMYEGDNRNLMRHIDRLTPVLLAEPVAAGVLRSRSRCILQGESDLHHIVNDYSENEGSVDALFSFSDAYEAGAPIIYEGILEAAVNRIMARQDAGKLKQLLPDLEKGTMTMQEIGAFCAAHGQTAFEDTLTLEEAEVRVDQEGMRSRIPLGFGFFDRQTRGLPRGRVSILAAKPGVGKTDFALACAINMLRDKKNVFFASLEMDYYEIVGRLRRSIGSGKMLSGSMTLDTAGRQTVSRIAAQVAQLKPELVIVDYLQILDTTETYRGLYERTSELSNQLRAAAKGTVKDAKTAPAWLVLSQLSRNTRTEHDRPVMADLRDSGAIEQDADMVMFLHEPDQRVAGEQSRRVELSVAKNRGGPCGYVRFNFTPGSSRWEE